MPLVLGGVTFDHPRGLVGHSDGDVIAHALTDALLGAAGLGDIGSLFPSDDEAYRGADSLVTAGGRYARVRAAGFELVNADCVLIGEEPRIAAVRDEMSARLAGALGVGADRVTVRATTTDHLGFTGRGEGLAAQAVALLSRERVAPTLRAAAGERDAGAAARPVFGPDAAALSLHERTRDRQTQPPPRPERARSPRQKRSNIRSRASSPSPSPVSSTVTCTTSWFADTRTATEPSEGVWRRAFVSRFWRTRCSSTGANRARTRVADLGVQPDAPQAGFGLDAPQRGEHRAGDGSLLELEAERSGVDLRELEEVVDHRRQRPCLLLERRQRLGRLHEAVLQRLQHRLDIGERGAEVVARPGDELPAGVEEPLEVDGHLVERRGEVVDLRRADAQVRAR